MAKKKTITVEDLWQIQRLGAKQDGILRSHQLHADGSLRDTVVFSIIASEWPAVRQHLMRRIDRPR